MRNLSQSDILRNNDVVKPQRMFEYDLLYRLKSATGREHAGQNADVQQDENGFPIVVPPNSNDAQAMRSYVEEYVYDKVGNITQMKHTAGTGSWTRRYEVATDSNRLLSTSMPGDDGGIVLGQVRP